MKLNKTHPVKPKYVAPKLTTAQKLFYKVKDEITFFDFIAEYVALKPTKACKNWTWRGSCLFCKEKERSLFVDERGYFFRCIECGKAGSVITFIAFVIDHDPMAAALYLARKFKLIAEELPLKEDE